MYGELARAGRVDHVAAHVVTDEELLVMRAKSMIFPLLDHDQSEAVGRILDDLFIPKSPEIDNDGYIRMFLMVKHAENRSVNTLEYYASELRHASDSVGKSFEIWTSDDIREFMTNAAQKVSPTTVNNKVRVLSSFFSWMEGEGYVQRNPIRKVRSMKSPKRTRAPFSATELERIRAACRCDRERAMVEFLLSSGVRAGELSGLRLGDVDFSTRTARVIGKGDKERTVYFSEQAGFYLDRYLKSRGCESDALFASSRDGHGRLSVGAIESIVRGIGRRAGVKKTHPHRFRHTMATDALKRGMPIEEIKELLGHEKIETTLIYAEVDKLNVLNNARRLIG